MAVRQRIKPGTKYNDLTLVSYKKYEKSWFCLCKCGKETIKTTSNLVSGQSKNCGCENSRRKHGMTKTLTYANWQRLKHHLDYPICKAWDSSFITFFNDMGVKPDGKVIRLLPGAREFSKDNCFWGE